MRPSLAALFEQTIRSLEPGAFVGEYLRREPLAAGEVTLLALGKAAVAMTMGAREVLGSRIAREVVVAPVVPQGAPSGWLMSDHPVPSERSEAAARALLEAAAEARGPILALISGGGSALAALPVPGLSLQDKAELVQQVYRAGADIQQLNIVRKHLSSFKGGRLAAAASQSVTTLLLSDVLGDSLSTIASGPTCVDISTFGEALSIVQTYCGKEVGGPAAEVLRAGVAGLYPETLKTDRPADRQVLLAGMSSLVEHASECARLSGATVHLMPRPLDGPVGAVADEIVAIAGGRGPGLWVGGGEATISLPSQPGVGGRAQHLALLLAERIRDRPGLQVLVAGSDGVDGNSHAAGAVVDGSTWSGMEEAGLDPRAALEACDSARVLGAVGAQIVTGPTGVNHADLVLVQIS